MKSFEEKAYIKKEYMPARKIYKSEGNIKNNMIPSDPIGSLDEFFFLVNNLNLRKFC